MRVVPKGLLFVLVAAATLLPIAITLVIATSFLFAGFQDAAVVRVLNGVALTAGLLWVLDLVGLVVLLSLDSLVRTDTSAEPGEDEG